MNLDLLNTYQDFCLIGQDVSFSVSEILPSLLRWLSIYDDTVLLKVPNLLSFRICLILPRQKQHNSHPFDQMLVTFSNIMCGYLPIQNRTNYIEFSDKKSFLEETWCKESEYS